MQFNDKIRLLKALPILRRIPERQLSALAGFLRPKELKDGEPVFSEGALAMSLYFVSSGSVRISMRVDDDELQDLAILGPGELFGEMALLEKGTRIASVVAVGPSVLFELFRGDLSRWVKSNPQQAIQFFAELVHVQSQRLRRTSSELTLHTDLSNLLLDESTTEQDFVAKLLNRILPRLKGSWAAAVFLSALEGGEEEIVRCGEFTPKQSPPRLPVSGGSARAWLDDSVFRAVLTGRKMTFGYLDFYSEAPVSKDDRDDLGRTMASVSRQVSIALEVRKLPRR